MNTSAAAAEDPRLHLGAAIRRLHHAVVGHEANADDLVAAANIIDSLCERFEPGARRSRPTNTFNYEQLLDAQVGDVLPAGYGDRPFGGLSSPLSLAFTVTVTERAEAVGGIQAEATITLGAAHEGAPQRSHGGIVAAFFDDLTGFVLQLARTSAYTGELTTRFIAGAPLGKPLVGRAWLTGRERRKIFINAELHDGETLIATCRTVYIAVPSFEELHHG